MIVRIKLDNLSCFTFDIQDKKSSFEKICENILRTKDKYGNDVNSFYGINIEDLENQSEVCINPRHIVSITKIRN